MRPELSPALKSPRQKPDAERRGRILPGWVREGVEIYSAAQAVALDLLSLPNASILNAVRRGLAPADIGPAGEAACETIRSLLQVQSIFLDLAQRHNRVLGSALGRATPAGVGIVEAFTAGIDSIVEAQKGLVAVAERQTQSWLRGTQGESAGEIARHSARHLARSWGRLLESLGKPARPAKATHLPDMVRQSVDAFAHARDDLLEIVRRQIGVTVRAARRSIVPTLPAVEAADVWTAVEYLMLHAAPVYYGVGVPRGDGSAVLLVPGFLSADLYLLELYAWLRRIGYRPYFSGIGLNAECPDLLIRSRLSNSMDRALDETGHRIHIIGHSLGGIIARSVACQRPNDVESIITLGAPVRDGGVLHSRALQAAEIVRRRILLEHGPRVLDQCYTGHCACDFVKCARGGLPGSIVHTAVYTRHDRIVDWRYCTTGDPDIDVEVVASHAGLVFNPKVYETIGSRLAAATTTRRKKASGSRRKRAVKFRV